MTADWELFEQAQSGRESAWRELLERHGEGLTKMAYLITGSLATAQDIVQDSFVELYRKPPRHRRGSFRSYLSTMVYHGALKAKRRALKFLPFDGNDDTLPVSSPPEDFVSKERDRAVANTIMSLDREHRDILILRFYGGHSYETISEMMALPLGTVKSRIFYAVKSCRVRLRKEGWLE